MYIDTHMTRTLALSDPLNSSTININRNSTFTNHSPLSDFLHSSRLSYKRALHICIFASELCKRAPCDISNLYIYMQKSPISLQKSPIYL